VRAKPVLIGFFVACVLSACSLGSAAAPTPTATISVPPTQTSIPTPSTPLAVLVVPADMDKAASDAYQKTVYDLAQGSGLRFQVRNTFASSDVEAGLKVLIALPPDPGIAAISAAAPAVQILAVNIPGIAAQGNVSTLATSTQVGIPAFVAGYTAAMLSADYRAGMIVPKDDPVAQQAAGAFANGMAYYCGLCTSFRLYLDQTGQAIRFPQYAQIPTDENPGRLGGWVNFLVGNEKADAVYVYPDPKLAVQGLFDALGQTGAQIISVSEPSPKPAGWVMAIRPDEVKAIQSAWPNLLAGQGGQTVPSPLGLADVDPNFLSPGKQRLVQKVLDDLQSGRLFSGTSQ
jgi:hypothetical protein